MFFFTKADGSHAFSVTYDEHQATLKQENLYILGRGISHSRSPVMYNALYEKLGLDWHYDFMDLPSTEKAQEFLAAHDFLSINITTPYKPEAYKAATYKAATAKLARGVNLLVNKDGVLVGYNVDGDGCVSYLEREGVDFTDKRVAVCGTGPTSLSILHACAQAGAKELLLLGRDKDRCSEVISRYLDEYHHLASTAIDLPSAIDGHLSFVQAYENADFKFGSYSTSKNAIAAADRCDVVGHECGRPRAVRCVASKRVTGRHGYRLRTWHDTDGRKCERSRLFHIRWSGHACCAGCDIGYHRLRDSGGRCRREL